MSGFSFRGIHSGKFGISTQDQNRTILPPRRMGKITIPGRSGYYGGVIGNVYDERSESIICTFKCPVGKTVPEMCREIAYWLSGRGRLAYDKEPDKYYTASVSIGPPMAQHLKVRRIYAHMELQPAVCPWPDGHAADSRRRKSGLLSGNGGNALYYCFAKPV